MITDLQNTNNNWIYQSNRLIETCYTLTVMEQKLIRLLASMIKKDDDDFKEYVKNIIGYMRTIVKDFKYPKENIKIDNFNNYEQREYNFEELEKVLLGEKNIEDTNIYK